jgi:hypothetical protein
MVRPPLAAALLASATYLSGLKRECLRSIEGIYGRALTAHARHCTTEILGAYAGGTIYVGGFFDRIGGADRLHIAALDATAAATSWNPNATVASGAVRLY